MSWDEVARKAQRAAVRQANKEAFEAARVERNKQVVQQAAEFQKRQAEIERQKWVPRTLLVANRGLCDVLIHEPHRRGKNWVAIVAVDPTMPGGLSRVFFDRARSKGPAKYIVPERLQVGNILEFGADYMTSVGKTHPDRRFAFVLSVTDQGIEVQPYPTFEEAIGHKLVRVG